jgi:hypothetical protein
MLRSFLDHIVITAPSLEEGIRYVHRVLDVPLAAGGQHPRMGTHNCLLKLGRAQYLEVIAIDPDAPPPSRPRWFELDRKERPRAPRLAGWVVRVEDIRIASAQVFGSSETMSRGSLEWRITIPEDGGLPFEGVAPMLIQWTAGPHPAMGLPEQECSLVQLEGFHPRAEKIREMLGTIGFQDVFSVSGHATPQLIAHLQTPGGMRRLSTCGDDHG